MPVPYTFGTATASIPLSQLDSNFATAITIGNTAVQLGNTVTTLNNMTLANVTISSGNVTITNVSVTTANVSGTANVQTLAVTQNATVAGNVTVTGNVSMNVATITTSNVTTENVSSLIVTGNQTFVGTGNRITGDFSNATVANRVLFQSSTTNGNTNLELLPNGTATAAYFVAGSSSSDPANASSTYMACTSTESQLAAHKRGTGTYLPMTFYTGGSERMRVDTSGNVGIGTSSPTKKLSVNGDIRLGDGGGTGAIFTDATNGLRFMQPASGTSSTESMRIDSSGNVGIGTSSPSYKLDILTGGGGVYAAQFGNGTAAQGMRIVTGMDSTSSGITTGGGTRLIQFDGTNNVTQFYTNGSERMRIDSSGNLLVGTTTYINSAQSHTFKNTNSVYPSVNMVNQTNDNKAVLRVERYQSDGDAITFFYGSTQKGYITVASTGTTYNTLSDYRLKENVKPMVGALEKIAALKPVTYDWIGIGKTGQGFIAHELKAIVPECVTGEKDELDDEGNPKYQGVDTSFLVATLTAAIQEQQAIIQQLQADVATLKGQK